MTRSSIEQYLYSRRNMAGTVLGLGGLGLFLAGITTWPLWLPITAALYAIGVLVVPPERGIDLRLGPGQDADAIRRGLDGLVRQIRGRVADDIVAKVAGIREGILATMTSEAAASGAERDLYLIRQTALDYLPGALDAYLALPRRYAERRAVAGGRTAHDVLLEQLQLMESKMAEVADDIARHDTDRLLAHGRFLRDKFAGSSLDLPDATEGADTVPAEVAAPAPTPIATPQTQQAVAEHGSIPSERERVH